MRNVDLESFIMGAAAMLAVGAGLAAAWLHMWLRRLTKAACEPPITGMNDGRVVAYYSVRHMVRDDKDRRDN